MAFPPSMALPPSTANWHWKNKNITQWGKEWFERELPTLSVKSDRSRWRCRTGTMEIHVSDHTIINMPRSGWSRSSIAKLYWDGQAQPTMGPKSRERWLSQKYRMKSYAINCPISLWVKSALPLSTCYPREGVLDSIWHVRLVPMDPYYRPIAWSKCLIHGS